MASMAVSSFPSISGISESPRFRCRLSSFYPTACCSSVRTISCLSTSSDFRNAFAPISLERIQVSFSPVEMAVNGMKNNADLDYWIKYSISEIVKNVSKAPLLVRIYSDGEEPKLSLNSNTQRLKIAMESVVTDEWPLIRRRWGRENCGSPKGVILVEELGCKSCADEGDLKHYGFSGTKIWGLLVQGKGHVGGACYILKTCRVPSSCGLCTHFCLVKADSFVESAELQLKKLWLQRNFGGGDGHCS